MDRNNIDRLPEELLVSVFSYLDSEAPSERNIRHEPDIDLTKSDGQPFKEISLISKRWRRIVLPLLFRNARLRIDVPPQESWSSCAACGSIDCNFPESRHSTAEAVHLDMVEDFQTRTSTRKYDSNLVSPRMSASTTRESFEQPDESSTAAWAWQIYHVGQDFSDFIIRENLATSIRSFVLYTGRMLKGKLGRFPHQTAPREWRYPAAAAFWQQLLCLTDPDRILVLAPPMELACFTNAAIDTFGDWAFGDMEYHILELKQRHKEEMYFTNPSIYADLQSYPPQYPSFASSSLLYMRNWTHLTLNEGSFLKAYGTYEYFERGPPSLVYSIKQSLEPTLAQINLQRAGFDTTNMSLRKNNLPKTIRSFTYIAIFPFANHADFGMMARRLEELDLQFAPAPSSSILDDKSRIGKAELTDCWQEMLTAYHELAVEMGTFTINEAKFPRMKKVTCRDYQIPALDAELDDVFTPLCMPVWVEREQGIFTREAMDNRLPGIDMYG